MWVYISIYSLHSLLLLLCETWLDIKCMNEKNSMIQEFLSFIQLHRIDENQTGGMNKENWIFLYIFLFLLILPESISNSFYFNHIAVYHHDNFILNTAPCFVFFYFYYHTYTCCCCCFFLFFFLCFIHIFSMWIYAYCASTAIVLRRL